MTSHFGGTIFLNLVGFSLR